MPATDIRARIGWNLPRLRHKCATTQEEFATDSGFDCGYISGIERGVRIPSALTLEPIVHALEIDVSELVEREKAKQFAKR